MSGGVEEGAYSGLRVLDITSNIAGPFCTMILGDLGADVIKVEKPDGGDETRRMPPHHEGDSAVFMAMNRNKRSIVLDLKTDDGHAALLHLARDADVVIESFRPGVAERLGIGFDDLQRVNPSVLYCSISAFGRTESAAGLPGYDPLIQAFTGLMSMTGHPGAPPVRVASSVIDLTTGMWAAMGVMSALREQQSSPGPRRVEATLVDSGFALLGHQVASMTATGVTPGPLGSASPITAPYEAFQASDGWVMIAAGNDQLLSRLCRELELPELVDDSRFRTPSARVQNRELLHVLLERRLSDDTVASWVERIRRAGVPVGPVNDLSQAWTHPLVSERRLRLEVPETAGAGFDFDLVRVPIDHGKATVRRTPPQLGQHTDEILREIGSTAAAAESSRRQADQPHSGL